MGPLKKKTLLNKIKIYPEIDSANAEINFVKSYPTSAIIFGQKQYIGLSRIASYFYEDPDQGEGEETDAPIGSRTDVLFLNAKGDSVASWQEPYAAEWIASDDARYALFDVSFNGGEGDEGIDVALNLIDLQHNKQFGRLDVVTQDPHYYIVQSHFKEENFIRTYQNGSNKILRLIVNPYQRVAYYKIYEYTSAAGYNAGQAQIAKLSDANVVKEVRQYSIIKF